MGQLRIKMKNLEDIEFGYIFTNSLLVGVLATNIASIFFTSVMSIF